LTVVVKWKIAKNIYESVKTGLFPSEGNGIDDDDDDDDDVKTGVKGRRGRGSD